MSIDYSKFAFPKPPRKEKKIKVRIKGKKHRTTKETEIKKETKIVVWKRDNKKCIFCEKYVTWNYACCHYIKRSALGKGIEQNIFTACDDCHKHQEEGINSNAMTEYVRCYLKNIYKEDWNEEDLIYKKY